MAKERKTTSNTNFNNQSQSQQSEQAARAGMFDTTNELGFAAPPDTADFQALRDWRPSADPSIASRFGGMRQRAMASYNNIAGPYSTPELTAARMRAIDQDIGQQEGAAYGEDQFRQNQQRLGQLGTVAGLTAPISFNRRTSGTTGEFSEGSGQMSGTSSGTSNTVNTEPKPGLFGRILGGVLQGAATAAPFI